MQKWAEFQSMRRIKEISSFLSHLYEYLRLGDLNIFIRMEEENAANQNVYLMSLFGLLGKEGDPHPLINADEKQEIAHAQNMTQLSWFCTSKDYVDMDILSFFSTSGIPVVLCWRVLILVFQYLGSIIVWFVIS